MSKTNGLNKTLGLADVFCISAGAMISSGIFILPGIAFKNVGPSVFLAYCLAGVCGFIGALATVELATAMPLAGGIYYYTGRSMGPLAGTVSGLLNWSAIALKSTFAIFGLAEVMTQFFGLNHLTWGIGFTVVFLAINLIGTKEAAWAQIIMVILLFSVLGAYGVMGFSHLTLTRFTPFFAEGKGINSLIAEAAFVFVAFGGLLDVASISEEVKNPKRNLPLGMLSAIGAVTVCYMITLIVTVGILPANELSGSLTPLADAAKKYYGNIGVAVITIGAVMAFVTTANAGVMAAARFPYAMGRDKLIPHFFCKTYGSRRLPLPALLITGLAMIIAQFWDISLLVTVASTVIMLAFILTNLSIVIFRESGILNYRPSFKVPFYPLPPILGMLIFAWLIMELGISSVRMSIFIICAGVVLYFIFGRKITNESALFLLVKKLTRSRVNSHGLERELREIIRSRDNIVNDAFDDLIEHAEVEIFSEPLQFETVVRQIAERFTDMPLEAEELADSFIKREHISSTVISPEVAVPHVIIQGEGVFELAIVMNKQGIGINKNNRVKIAFFLIASQDCRNRHLRTLAAIAQIISSPTFEKRLEKTANAEQVRDLLLLAKRKRATQEMIKK